MIEYRDVVDNTVTLTHLAKKRVVDVIVEVAERYFLRQNCADVVRIVLKTHTHMQKK